MCSPQSHFAHLYFLHLLITLFSDEQYYNDHNLNFVQQEAASTKLSYAQMVARKQQSMTTAKLTMENGVPSQATPTPDCSTMPTTAQEHTQPSTTVSTPAHTKSTSVSASASFSGKETTSRNFEPKPQRFQGNRLPKDFRDNRRPRFDRHQGDYDVKVLAK